MPRDAPNILWIITTQWRARALGLAGDPNARTPHLDQLARRARIFTHAVTPHPFGPFARAAMLTGVPSPANGVRDYFDPLPAGARTIAHELRERGYATAWFGKWHLWHRDPAAPFVGEAHARVIVPTEARGGFETWEGFESGFLLNDPLLHGTSRAEPARMPGYQSDVLCQLAESWIQARAEARGPWFCVVSLEPPHPPYDAPAPASRPDPAGLALDPNVPRGGEVEARARRELAGYHAHITATDRAIGRLVTSLDARTAQAGRGCIVVTTSVHGDMHGAHGHFRKGWPHDESVGVPLVIRGAPGMLDSGEDVRPVSLLDLPAMAIAWAGRRVWEPSGEGARISMPSVVRLPDQCDRVWGGWRGADWKAVFLEDGTPWLVHDLAQDPWEMENLADDPRGAPILARARRLAAGQV